MATRNFTQKWVDSRRPGDPAHLGLTRDTGVTGLIIAVNKTSKTWKVQRDMWRGKRCKTIRHTLGTTDELSLNDARARAQEIIAQIRRGIDPNAATPAPPVGQMTVGELWDAYEAWLRTRGCAPVTLKDHRYNLDRYLDDWRNLPLSELRKSKARERHEKITRENGPYPANHAMRSLRAAYNYAIDKLDDDDVLRANPVKGVNFNPERRRKAIILPEDLPDWWRRTGALPNPLRVAMHRLGLLSGLRPGTLVSLEREWVDLDGQAVRIPRMKSGHSFDLPLSDAMVGLVGDALRIGDTLYKESQWLFPTRSNDGRRVIATQVWRERSMPGETGHILRHTYRTMADALGVPQSRARALLDHQQPGIEAHYLHASGLRDQLLADQERMTKFILETANA